MHGVTVRWLKSRSISDDEMGHLLDCTPQHARDLVTGAVEATARERAILRLCANVREKRLRPILDDLDKDYEWRRIPGYGRYEASVFGQIRRAAAGHGSMPGHVLRHKTVASGHMYVNIAPDNGPVRSMAVHRAIALAFVGPSPSRDHMVCHKNDLPADNRPENLYWGTSQDNADDRVRNTPKPLEREKIPVKEERLTQKVARGTPTRREMTAFQIKKKTKETMIKRLARISR